jgi:Spy/CpxP family protein refolding chaperone
MHAMLKVKTFRFTALLLLLCSSLPLLAQPGGDEGGNRAEKIKSWKIAYFTEQLNLTPEEAQKFWPVYNEYDGKLEDLRKKRRQKIRLAKDNLDEMDDKEIEALVDSEMTFRQQELDLQKEYHSKFKAVLPARKVAKLYAAEEQFKVILVKRMQELREKKGKGPR